MRAVRASAIDRQVQRNAKWSAFAIGAEGATGSSARTVSNSDADSAVDLQLMLSSWHRLARHHFILPLWMA